MAKRSGEIDDFDEIDEALSLAQDSVPLSRGEAADLLPELKKLHSAGIPRAAISIVQSGPRPGIVVAFRVSDVRGQVERLGLRHVEIRDAANSL